MTEKDEEYLVLSNNHNNFQYARACSNESSQLRNNLIDRHKGASCTITASGMQAISAVLHGIFIEHKFEHFHLVYANELYLETPGFFSYLKDLYNNLTLHAVDVRQPDTILDLFKTTIKGQPAIIFTEV
jgi:cystathionine beta-lyase/cystathionine gamma-synthase